MRMSGRQVRSLEGSRFNAGAAPATVTGDEPRMVAIDPHCESGKGAWQG